MAQTKNPVLRDLIVLALGRLGGAAARADVLAEMERLWGSNFDPADRELVLSREPRHEEKWRNNASYERQHMVSDGLLEQSRRPSDGVWRLDRRGRDRLAALSGIPTPGAPHADPLRRFAPKDSADYLAQLAGQQMVKSRAHEDLVNDYAVWIRGQGFKPFTLHPRDLVLEHPLGEWLVEAKVLYDGNAAEAVRAAIGQLYDYRYFFYVTAALQLPSLLGLFSESIGDAYVSLLDSLSIAAVWRCRDSWAGSSSAVAADLAFNP